MTADHAPPAHHAAAVSPSTATIDYDRVLRVIVALEGHRWEHPGGALGWQPATWREQTKLPFALASRPPTALAVAKERLARFAAKAAAAGFPWTPRHCFETWRWGYNDGIKRANRNLPLSYGVRGLNLYRDPTFR